MIDGGEEEEEEENGVTMIALRLVGLLVVNLDAIVVMREENSRKVISITPN